MFAMKQIFLILSLLSVASAKKGASLRHAEELVDNRRGLKKSSKKSGSSGSSGSTGGFVAPPISANRGGSIVGGSVGGANGVNRDGTTVGVLIEPVGKACTPFEQAQNFLSTDYPGDIQCRSTGQMGTTSACCRIFSFTDTNGPQKWLLYDSNNQYPDLVCVCNENTRSGSAPSNPIITVPTSPAASPVASPTVSIPIGGPAPVASPVASTGAAVCSNPNPTQLDLQSRPGVIPCVTNTQCGGDAASKCCSVDTCICYPKSFLDPSKCIPAA